MNEIFASDYCDGCGSELRTQEERVSGLCRKCYRGLQRHNRETPEDEGDFGFPHKNTRCEGCGKKTTTKNGLCDKCRRDLEKHNRQNKEGSSNRFSSIAEKITKDFTR